jgi:hypothetical protein
MSPETLQRMRALIEQAKPLCASENIFVKTAGDRIVAILVDALVEIDLTMANPWDELPAVKSARGATSSS